ncbi:unnamed protein product, partial [Nesidiocoris tenuis]
ENLHQDQHCHQYHNQYISIIVIPNIISLNSNNNISAWPSRSSSTTNQWSRSVVLRPWKYPSGRSSLGEFRPVRGASGARPLASPSSFAPLQAVPGLPTLKDNGPRDGPRGRELASEQTNSLRKQNHCLSRLSHTCSLISQTDTSTPVMAPECAPGVFTRIRTPGVRTHAGWKESLRAEHVGPLSSSNWIPMFVYVL